MYRYLENGSFLSTLILTVLPPPPSKAQTSDTSHEYYMKRLSTTPPTKLDAAMDAAEPEGDAPAGVSWSGIT
eukprot:CAMPEP_0181170196 /NCGR_PEP_ID=MMETSP1096-20121128/1230_1 /TAXON_ID=156174 ORGANISM="Chrysochromulina ericina, Strain CCMP281" /NCGR_SAMPLE_ID=MMETSP1096 /ASSEMBLY_ACC=CAM_ASM_000453 /LENGTH=71 /DNA_ID=CAMNT_0023257727 /DNA_START=16 /DNA_END=231 /DNA_ORIENTATION=+